MNASELILEYGIWMAQRYFVFADSSAKLLLIIYND
jgi:hypothetical protein